MKFKDIIGQENIKEKLVQSYLENRVSHSYLFYGPEGAGKLGLAIAFAQYLSCENKQGNDSCGHCPSCLKYEKLVHPDLHFVFPIANTGSKETSISDTFISEWREMVTVTPYFTYDEWLAKIGSEKKQGGIYVGESAGIIRKLSLKTYESDFKVMIIWLPEKMNIDCANKLLKILEEPPSKTVFILVSNKREDVLPTITSRTQPVKVLGIDDENMQNAIVEKFGISAEQAYDITKISNGSFTTAKNYVLDNEDNHTFLNLFIDTMRICYSADILKANELAEKIVKLSTNKQKGFLNYCLSQVRENFIYNTQDKSLLHLTKSEEEFSSKFARFVNPNNIKQLYMVFNTAYFHIERNVNAKIVFGDTLLKIMKVFSMYK